MYNNDMGGAVAYPGFVGGIFDDYMKRDLPHLSQDWIRIVGVGFYLPNCDVHLKFRGLLLFMVQKPNASVLQIMALPASEVISTHYY